MKKLLLASVISASMTLPVIASAQSAPAAQSAHTFTGNLGLASDYRFRGISQTFKQPAIQGGFDYAHASGFYLGTWASNVTGSLANGPSYNNGNMEWDFYGGYKWEVAKDLGLDIGLLYYWYPGAQYANPQKSKYNNLEAYLGVGYKWFSAKYSHGLTDYFGTRTDTYGAPFAGAAGYCGLLSDGATAGPNCAGASPGGSKASGYLELNANFEIAEKLTLGLHAGHQTVRHYSRFSYTDYKLSLTREWAGLNWTLAYVGTNADKDWWRAVKNLGTGNGVNAKNPGEGALIVSVQKNF